MPKPVITPRKRPRSEVSGQPDSSRTATPPVKKQVQPKRQVKPKQQPKQRKEPVKPDPKPSAGVEQTKPGATVSRLIEEGDRWLAEGKPEYAVDEYKKALKIKKGPGIYLKLYSAFRVMKNSILARAYISDGLAHYPRDFFLNKISAILHIRGKSYRDALANIETAVKQNDEDYTLFTYKGLCHFHLKDYKQGLLNFQRSLQLNSDAVENYYYIGLIFDNQKQYAKALEYYNAFFKLNPENRNFKHRKWVTRRIRALSQYIDEQR